jgi:O-methyltransferase
MAAGTKVAPGSDVHRAGATGGVERDLEAIPPKNTPRLRRLGRWTVDRVLVAPARRLRLPRLLLHYAARQVFGRIPNPYAEIREEFLQAVVGSRYGAAVRADIVRRFEAIDRGVNNTTGPSDGLLLAQALLNLEVEGQVVECGCFCGGSTAKLSILAKLTGRQLVVFDSFEGLPQTDAGLSTDTHMRYGRGGRIEWSAGVYDARLELVRGNVERFGEPSVCRFVKGWFVDTLTPDNVPPQIAFAFTDVDLASSARECLVALWPRLAQGAVYFSHDVAFLNVLQVFTDPELWRAVGDRQPVIFGAGYGFGDAAPHLGMMVKGAMTGEQISRLTLRMYCRRPPHREHGGPPEPPVTTSAFHRR